MDPTAANLESQSQHSHDTHEEEEGGHDMYDEAENADDDALAMDENNDMWGDMGHVVGNGGAMGNNNANFSDAVGNGGDMGNNNANLSDAVGNVGAMGSSQR